VLGSYLLWEAGRQVVVPTVGKVKPTFFAPELDYSPIKDITRQWKFGTMPETNEYIPPRSGESCQHKHFRSGNMVLTSLPVRVGHVMGNRKSLLPLLSSLCLHLPSPPARAVWKRIGCASTEGKPCKCDSGKGKPCTCGSTKGKPCKCSFVRPKRKAWKGDPLYCMFSNRRLKIRSGYEEKINREEQMGSPIVRSGRKLWERKWTAVEPATVLVDLLANCAA
jgi:hypothetical protein